MEANDRQLVFENGRVFRGRGFGDRGDAAGETVFSTSMVGYQELMSDPGCFGRLVVMTYPLIGNCGLTDEDYESRALTAGGLAVREYNDSPSNYRYTKTLAEEMEERGIPGIEGVDTRAIVRMLRNGGAMRALITDGSVAAEDALRRIRSAPEPRGQVAAVSCKKIWYSRTPNYRYNIVAVDCGIRHSVIRSLGARGCNLIVVPHDTPAERVLALKPDGVLLDGGPGDPGDAEPAVRLVREITGRLPVFGIGLGHHLIALAGGAKLRPLRAVRHGSNHPVKETATGRVEITAGARFCAVEPESLAGTGFSVTHRSLLDGGIEGLKNEEAFLFSVRFHPESAPGARDGAYLYDAFIGMIERFREGRAR